ncbi:MAG: hypothetical protein ACWA41_00380 [Putridiphycobacter sp.]
MRIIFLIVIIMTLISCGNEQSKKSKTNNELKMEDFRIEDLGIEIHCPKCNNEMANDQNSLPLAEARCGAMLECGNCGEITSWRWTLEPFKLEQVDNEWGGSIECE